MSLLPAGPIVMPAGDLRLQAAGEMRSIEIILNFPVMDMNMNVLWHDREKVKPEQGERMDAFWGDDTWQEKAYVKTPGLFGPVESKADNPAIAHAFQERLSKVAGFKFVPDPMPMRNSRGNVVYYLFFASPNKTGAKIVGDIFAKYRDRGIR